MLRAVLEAQPPFEKPDRAARHRIDRSRTLLKCSASHQTSHHESVQMNGKRASKPTMNKAEGRDALISDMGRQNRENSSEAVVPASISSLSGGGNWRRNRPDTSTSLQTAERIAVRNSVASCCTWL